MATSPHPKPRRRANAKAAPRLSPQRILEMSYAFYESAILFTASDLFVFSRLAGRPADAATLATDLGLDPRGLKLLLNACVAIGLLEKDGPLYRNAPDADAFLVRGRPADLSRAIRYNRHVYQAWGRLTDFVRSGKPVELPDFQSGADAQRTRASVLAMHWRALSMGGAVVDGLDLAGCSRLLDVAGGAGTYAALIAKRYPGIACTVLDLPPIVEIAADLIAQQKLSARISTLAANYREIDFPRGFDCVTIFGLLHQEDPDSIRRLLRKSYAALLPGGSVYVLDMMTDATRAAPPFSALFGLNMALTSENGWVFADSDLREWMAAAGFTGFEIIPVPPPIPQWLVRAHKP